MRNVFLAILFILFTFLGTGAAADKGHQAKQSTISAEADIITMINVLTPETGNQQDTIAHLREAMEQTMRFQPGFISANIHQSLNSNHVVVYAQWLNQHSVDAVAQAIEAGEMPLMARVFTNARADFHPYRVVSTHRSKQR